MRRALNIQEKILIVLFLPSVCLAVLICFSYANLLRIEQRIRVLGRIDEAQHSIIELRRQGKFFLFYEGREEFQAAEAAAAEATALMREIQTELLFSGPQAMAQALLERLGHYQRTLQQVREASGLSREAVLALKSEAHAVSMALEDEVMAFSAAVRERISHISESLRGQLLVTALGVALLFVGLGLFIRSQVLKPLKSIEETTRKIARGEFTPVPLSGGRDEIRDVQEAFNSMVSELKNRQEQLVQSQKLSSVGTLSAGIAHQVNNPLNNISLSAQYLADKLPEGLDASTRKALDNIEKETARARDIVRGLLDFSRSSEFQLARVDLKSVTDKAVSLASAQLVPGVRIESAVPEGVFLDLDPRRMSEALLNIILNGVQAIGQGPGQVRLFLEDGAPEGRLRLVVEDSGSGIAPEDLSRIFDPFFTRKEVGRGTGLGLSVAHGIIQDCGGSVTAASVVGRGTRLCIELPLP